MKILITGASGFIGSALIDRLANRREVEPWGATRYAAPPDVAHKRCHWIKVNWDDARSVCEMARGKDIVFHIAGEITARHWSQFHRSNVANTEQLFRACLKEKVQKFVFMSSISAAGPLRDAAVLDESMRPCPNGLYGLSKLKAEKRLTELKENSNIQLYLIRAPVVYGPGQNPLFSKILKKALGGKLFFIGKGNNLRSLCFIENLVDIFERIALEQINAEGLYYVADKEIFSMNEFADIISRIAGIRIKIKRLPKFLSIINDSLHCLLMVLGVHSPELFAVKAMYSNVACKIEKASRLLAYNPRYSLFDGLKITIDWLEKINSANTQSKDSP